jgi:tripartite-type tricarboxylate transporter receptor subunit TctC
MIGRRTFLSGIGGLALSLAAAWSALAQSYPNRPVQMIVPWAAGGGTDTVARIPIEALALAQAGRVKVLAVMDTKRLSSYPDVPTLKEATGLDWTFVNWFAFVLPKGIPDDVRTKLIEAAARAHARPEVQEALKARGITPVWETPEEFRAFATKFANTTAELLTDLGLAKN